MSDWHSPWWYERLEALDRDEGYDPRDDPANPNFEPLPEEYEPRIDSLWDEREEDARIRRGLEA
jgi:hypothetical protein